MQLIDVARTSDSVRRVSARLAKRDRLAACLRRAAPDEVAIVVAYLSGELPQRQIGVGYAALRDPPPPATAPVLTVAETDAAFTRIKSLSGPGSVGQRRRLLHEVLARATAAEQAFLIRLLAGELRQGALDGVMADAIAVAGEVPAPEVRRAVMLRGSLGAVAAAALAAGGDADRAVAALRAFGLEVGRPVKPMLAQSADTPEAALRRAAAEMPAAVEWKIDGIRVQAHIDGTDVRLFTRTLDDISSRVPEVVEALRELPVDTAVLDGELIALRDDGRPHPFQVTAARAARRRGGGEVPLTAFLFDLLHVNGTDYIDRPGSERYAALAEVVPPRLRIPRVVTADVAEATAFFQDALAHGHEGVMVKSLGTPYTAGRRGAGWIKVKPRHTLDLVVLAAEWGHGRRRGTLSNLHLGARDPDTDGFVMLGKTFKGLTDEMLAWQTEHLLTLADRRDDWVVHVRPELVVEVAFDGVQRSSRYPGGLALRFARVLRHRPDKNAAEADTFETVRRIGAALGFAPESDAEDRPAPDRPPD